MKTLEFKNTANRMLAVTALSLIALTGCSESEIAVKDNSVKEEVVTTIQNKSELIAEKEVINNELSRKMQSSLADLVNGLYDNPGRVDSAERNIFVDETGNTVKTIEIVSDKGYLVKSMADSDNNLVSFELVETTYPSDEQYEKHFQNSARYAKPENSYNSVKLVFKDGGIDDINVEYNNYLYTNDPRMNEVDGNMATMMGETYIKGIVVDPTVALEKGLIVLEDLVAHANR